MVTFAKHLTQGDLFQLSAASAVHSYSPGQKQLGSCCNLLLLLLSVAKVPDIKYSMTDVLSINCLV